MNQYLRTMLLCAALTATSASVLASENAEPGDLPLSKAKISLQDAVDAAVQKVGGKAVRAEFEHTSNGLAFDVEILNGNQTFDVRIDPMTANVLSSKKDQQDNYDAQDDDDAQENDEGADPID